MIHKVILTGIVALVAIPLFSQGERKFIRQGNREYEEDKFDESEILYRKALEKDNKSFEGTFNLGDALYKQEKYEDAAGKFKNLAESEEDRGRLGALYHNLGNSLLQSQKLEESIEAYKNALRNNPADEETRHNLAFAQNLLQQQQQQQQQQDQQDDQQDQQDQDQQDQQDQDQQDRDQQNDQQDQQNQDRQQQQQQPQISREDAERMLQALQEDEQKLQEKLQKQKARAARVKVLKDW